MDQLKPSVLMILSGAPFKKFVAMQEEWALKHRNHNPGKLIVSCQGKIYYHEVQRLRISLSSLLNEKCNNLG